MRGPAIALVLMACGPGGDGWEWKHIPETRCADGRPTGFGLRGTGDDLMVYLAGGGACWDAATCYGLDLAWNVTTGYGDASFAVEPMRLGAIFELFPKATQVFVPYCTGDLHSGTATRTHVVDLPTHHVGAKNLAAILARLPVPKGRVFVVGTSAGGFGAQLQAGRFVEAFPGREVLVLADSAPMVARQEQLDAWTKAWGAELKLGGTRVGLVASKRDWLIGLFANRTPDEMEAAVTALVASDFSTPDHPAFVVDGSQHVFFDSLAQPGLRTWLADNGFASQ